MDCRDTERGGLTPTRTPSHSAPRHTGRKGGGRGEKGEAQRGIGAPRPHADAHLGEQLSPETSQNAPSRAIIRLSFRMSSNILNS